MSHFQFLTIYFQLSILWFLMSAFQPTKNCLQLKGVVEDYASHSAIGQAQLFSKDSDGNSKAVGQTNENGFFEIEIPCETLNLIIKSKGYRPQNIVLSFAKNNPQLVILIPMVAVDAQASDQIGRAHV